jgi:uncharacterized membrane protein YuzA (DUF378 family)
MAKMHWLEHVSMLLLITGALLWGINGVTGLFGTPFILTGWFWEVIYTLVGLAGLGGVVHWVRSML